MSKKQMFLRSAWMAGAAGPALVAMATACCGADEAKPATAAAQTPAATAAPAAAPQKEPSWVDKSKNPVSWFKWGADLRIRDEYYNNVQTLADHNYLANPAKPYNPNPADKNYNPTTTWHEQNLLRYRTRFWNSIEPVKGLSFNSRLTWEGYEFTTPSNRRDFETRKLGWEGLDAGDGIVDTLNIKATIDPVAITVGRQDMRFGEGWLIMDGTTADGSRTLFFDAARVTYDAKPIKTTFDMVGIYQNALEDATFPTIRHMTTTKPYVTVEDEDARGMVFYVSNKSIKNVQLDGYYIYKTTDPYRDPFTGPNQGLPVSGYTSDIHTIGSRVVWDITEHIKYRVEGAYQFGERNGVDVSAGGMNSELSYNFKDSLKNQVRFTYEYLSGDDPNSKGTDEMFDVLWGRWPRFSEIAVRSFAPETGNRAAQYNNLHRFGPGWSITPLKNLDYSLDYWPMFTDQEVPTRASAATAANKVFSNDDNFRGHFVTTGLKYKFNQYMSGHLLGEFLFPGNFYNTDEMMTFLRAEVVFTY